MTAFSAWREGMRRVNRAPAVLAGVWALTALVTLPHGLPPGAAIGRPLGNGLVAKSVANPISDDWMQEFSAQETRLGVIFKPTIIGFGAVLDNVSGFLESVRRPIVVDNSAAIYMGLWIFIAGGIIDRYARDRATRAYGFFSASGVFFFRFLRLGVVMVIVYGLIFRYLHPWLFDRIYPRIVHDVTAERTAFFTRVFLYAVFGIVVAACNVIFDYTKVRAVVEDRRSMIGAIAAALRFIQRNFVSAASLYVLDFVLLSTAIGVYAAVAPGTGATGWSVWIGVALGQLYMVARLWVKLVFWASETALFQGRLAHAGYVAAPAPVWPESPAAEAIRN